ncbi:MAG: RIP metalloprotease RseP [Gammaproteobacteria bacterium]
MISTLISILAILATILFVIGTHEWAHFYTARLLGVKVLRFSIGFGKTLLRWKGKTGTEYVFALVPLGGYVKMLDEREGNVAPHERRLAYNYQPYYKKCLIVLAGPAMNLLCAVALYWIIFMIGFYTIRPIIGDISPQSIAAKAGLQANQEIVQIDGEKTQTWNSILLQLLTHLGNQDTVQITTTKAHHLDLADWHMDELTPDPLTSLGILPLIPAIPLKMPPNLIQHIQYSPIAALPEAWKQVKNLTFFNFMLFGKLITGKISLQSLGGPITIYQNAGGALNMGILAFLSFLAFLSISIGVINLLPIPGLDGGHLLIQTIEAIIRRPVSEKVLLNLYRAGFFVIIFVMVQALINDLLRL